MPDDSNIRKKVYEKLGKYQGQKEELERVWKSKGQIGPSHGRSIQAVISKLGEWLQQSPVASELCPEDCGARNSEDTV